MVGVRFQAFLVDYERHVDPRAATEMMFYSSVCRIFVAGPLLLVNYFTMMASSDGTGSSADHGSSYPASEGGGDGSGCATIGAEDEDWTLAEKDGALNDATIVLGVCTVSE